MELNVLAEPLQSCSKSPLTGFTRNGCCSHHPQDQGKHLVCIQVSDKFLRFSAKMGNDLSTPMPQYDFFGLKDKDCWCLCAERWVEALKYNHAPAVVLASTHINALEICDLEDLKKYAIDLN